MEKSISDTRLMDTSRLRIVDGEGLVRAVAVGMMGKVGLKIKDITHQSKRELLDIRFLALVS